MAYPHKPPKVSNTVYSLSKRTLLLHGHLSRFDILQVIKKMDPILVISSPL